MEDHPSITERLEQAATVLERTLAWLEERQLALTGEVQRISATIEGAGNIREQELAEKLAAAEQEIAQLKAAAANTTVANTAPTLIPGRKTIPASTTEMLAKRGISDGPVDVRALDAALAGLSLEQRIAVKSQLLRAGALS